MHIFFVSLYFYDKQYENKNTTTAVCSPPSSMCSVLLWPLYVPLVWVNVSIMATEQTRPRLSTEHSQHNQIRYLGLIERADLYGKYICWGGGQGKGVLYMWELLFIQVLRYILVRFYLFTRSGFHPVNILELLFIQGLRYILVWFYFFTSSDYHSVKKIHAGPAKKLI